MYNVVVDTITRSIYGCRLLYGYQMLTLLNFIKDKLCRNIKDVYFSFSLNTLRCDFTDRQTDR